MSCSLAWRATRIGRNVAILETGSSRARASATAWVMVSWEKTPS